MAPSYMVSQWCNLSPEALSEIARLMDKHLAAILARGSGQNMAWAEFAQKAGELSKNKQKFLDAWPEQMASHPVICETVGIAQSNLLARSASAIPFDESVIRVCYPHFWGKSKRDAKGNVISYDKILMIPGIEGYHVCGRIPVDGPTPYVLDMDDFPELYPYIKLIGIQGTLTALDPTGDKCCKNVWRVVDDDDPDILPIIDGHKVDVIVSTDDQKLGERWEPGLYPIHGGVNFMSVCDEDSTCILNPLEGAYKWGADFDWDMLFALSLTENTNG